VNIAGSTTCRSGLPAAILRASTFAPRSTFALLLAVVAA
jgi:hypothetical protein